MNESRGTDREEAEPSAAVRWFCRSLGDESKIPPEERADWERWIADPTHAQEFERVKAVWDRLGALPTADELTADEDIEDDYDEDVPVARWLEEQERRLRPTSSRLPIGRWAIAACGVLATAVLAWAFTRNSHWITPHEIQQRYSTSAAEHRTITLEDGSLIALGARTELSTHYTAARRVIFLERGEAWFSVAHNPQRPFTVLAGAGAITAIGTQFNVLRDPDANLDRVTVTVTNGAVVVGPPKDLGTRFQTGAEESGAAATWMPSKLIKGQEITYDVAGPEGHVNNTDPESAAAWREGRLEYRHTPLSVVIPRVSRYSTKPIVLADTSAGELQFTGTVFEKQVGDWLRALQTAYPIEITESKDRIVIRSRDDGSQTTSP